MRFFFAAAVAAFSTLGASAQMTVQQKQLDFQQLVALYDKDYAFYEWKRDAIGFDLLKLQPWLDKIAQTTDDLGYYELAGQYVGSLIDGHDTYLNPSDFSADLRFTVDLYDSKVLVDAIDTVALPTKKYNIQIGDELVSVDGKTPEEYIADYSKYFPDGALRSTRRDAVSLVPFRPQAINPRAAIVGDSAAVVLRGSDGSLKNLTIPWVKTGTLFTSIGPVPNPAGAVNRSTRIQAPGTNARTPRPPRDPVVTTSTPSTPAQIFYRSLTKRFQLARKPFVRPEINGVEDPTPVYRPGLGAAFRQRLGRRASDFFFSGTYISGNYTIGLIRIPDFCVSDPSCSTDPQIAIPQFQSEIAYMKQNTDGLVVDVTRNPGGYGYYGLQLMDFLTDKPYTHAGFLIRPQYSDILNVNETLAQAASLGLEQWQIDILTAFGNEVTLAYRSNRGMTGPLPLDYGWSLGVSDYNSLSFDHPPVLDSTGKALGYNKPVIVLVDEGSYSAAELFAAAFQDAKRGLVLGMPTAGLGGAREDTSTGVYSEAATSVTVARLLRSQPISNPFFPAAPYIENIGVQPDSTIDFQTLSNLKSGGKDYVQAFTNAIVALLPAK